LTGHSTGINLEVNYILNFKTNILLKGEKCSIFEIVENCKSAYQKFYNGLTEDRKETINARLKYISNNGPPRNKSRFNYEGDGIYAIKDVSKGIRVYCFFDENHIILSTNGAIKKTQKANPQELKKAKRLKEEYFKRKGEKK